MAKKSHSIIRSSDSELKIRAMDCLKTVGLAPHDSLKPCLATLDLFLNHSPNRAQHAMLHYL